MLESAFLSKNQKEHQHFHALHRPKSIKSWWNKHVSGLIGDIGKELFDPEHQQNKYQYSVNYPIMMTGTQSQSQQDYLHKSFKEFEGFEDLVYSAVEEEFGQYVGRRNIRNDVRIKKDTKEGLINLPAGTNAELYEKARLSDGIS